MITQKEASSYDAQSLLLINVLLFFFWSVFLFLFFLFMFIYLLLNLYLHYWSKVLEHPSFSIFFIEIQAVQVQQIVWNGTKVQEVNCQRLNKKR